MAAAPLPPPVSSAVPEAAPLSEGARIINTFMAPSKTFTDLRRNASWWAPWLLISIFSVAFLFTIGKQIGYEQAARYQIAHSTRASQLPADQQERQVQFSVKIFQGITYGFPVAILFFTVIPALVLWVTFKVGFSAETTFGQAFAIGMYAGLPNIINAILGIISLFAGVNPEGFDSNNPVGTNLAYYLDPDTTSKFVRSMASSLDVIIIWTIVLLGIGYASTSKVKKSTAIIVVACWYLAWKLITSGLATLG